MRNKKGFTLTEVLVTIAIIGIVLLIAVPSIMAINRSVKKRELETKKEVLISAAEKYAKNNTSEFGGATIIRIPVRTLVYYGYVTSDKECEEEIGCVINPTNDESMNDEIITIKRNMSITQATWDNVEGNTVMATFYRNGASKFSGADYIEIGCEGNTYLECEIRSPRIERDEFEIIGWGTSANDKTAVYGQNERIRIRENEEFYAVTRKDVVITFNGNGGIIDGENKRRCSYYNTESSCEVEDVMAHRIGYGKEGWYTSAEGTTKVSLNSVDRSQTVYAHWTEGEYTLSYNLKEGSAENPTSYKVSTETFTLNNPTKRGYTFTGWTGTDLSGLTQTVTISKGSVGDRDYEAFYDVNTFTVAYNANGGSGTTASHTCTYNSSCTLKSNSFTRGGHIFSGWKKGNTGSALAEGASIRNVVESGTVTYYAQWGACPAGKYAQAGATSCSDCIGNTYTSSAGQSSCSACPAGQAVNSTHTGCTTNVLTLLYNGNGHTGFSSTSTSHSFTVDSSGYVLDNGVRYSQTANYGSVFDSSSGLANYNNSGFINFTKTGYHGVKNAEWKIGTTTFGHNDKTVTAEALAQAGGCNLSTQSCTVTAYVNWTQNGRLFIQYNGNGGTWGSTNTSYDVNEYGTVITTSNNQVYTQIVNYGESLSSDGFVNANGSCFKWTKAGYIVSSSKAYYIKTDSNKTKLSQATSYEANYLAELGGCTNFYDEDCVIQLKVNWSACAKGAYAALGDISCSSCPKGKYSSSTGSASCSSCPTGYTTSGTGSTSKSNCYIICSANTRVASADAQCTACASGYVSDRHTVYAGNTSSCTKSGGGGGGTLRGCSCKGTPGTSLVCDTDWYGTYNASGTLCVTNKKSNVTECCQ